MTFQEAIATQPAWIGMWLQVLLFGAFVLPLSLLIWKQTRVAAIATVFASLVGGVTTQMLYGQVGYVKLLGLPHIIFWTPIMYFLYTKLTSGEVPAWPKRIVGVVMVIIGISLVFDYVDVARYVLGERESLIPVETAS